MDLQRVCAVTADVVSVVALGLSLIALPGCSEVKPPAIPPPVPPPAAEVLLKTEKPQELVIERLEEQRREPAKQYNLRFKDADVRDVLRSFSRTSPFNFIYGPEVKGAVTVELKEVTIEEALKAILLPILLEFKKDGNFIRVYPQKMETRIYNVNYVNTVRMGMTGTFAGGVGGGGMGGGGMGGGGMAGGGLAGGAGAGTGGGGMGGGGGGMGASFSSVTSTDRADVFTDLENTVKAILSKDGKTSVNRTAGTLVVTDFPFNLEQVQKYLEIAQTSLQRQVRIEANIVEVQLRDEFQFGVDWVAMSTLFGGAGAVTSAVGVANKVIVQNLGSDLTNRFQLGVKGKDFGVILSWLASQGKVSFVSRPTVSTLNNQRALIQIGRQEVFFQVSNIVGTALTPGQAFSIPQTVFVGLSLSVTPHIGDDGVITMIILPTESSVDGTVTNPVIQTGGSNQAQSGATVPILSVREAQAVVRVRDAETIILGGLMQERKTQDVQKVPFFGDIPYVGKLFQRIEEKAQKTELVIFLTPTIVDNQMFDSMAQEARRAADRALGR